MNLHKQAGLTDAGINSEGEQLWIGTTAQWKAYEQLETGEAMGELVSTCCGTGFNEEEMRCDSCKENCGAETKQQFTK
jgi:hypothetical protein